ncbi:hypothetical protein [Brachybacterium epidermidis]|uniref:hypothetical protein n=1 Tax=Brachybacterium epidermidis TaxID=2781983 RepID=UPI00398F32EA
MQLSQRERETDRRAVCTLDGPAIREIRAFARAGTPSECPQELNACVLDVVGHGSALVADCLARGYDVAVLRVSEMMSNEVDLSGLVDAVEWIIENHEDLFITSALLPMGTEQPEAEAFFESLCSLLVDEGIDVIASGRSAALARGLTDAEPVRQWPADLSSVIAVDEVMPIGRVTASIGGLEVHAMTFDPGSVPEPGTAFVVARVNVFESLREFEMLGLEGKVPTEPCIVLTQAGEFPKCDIGGHIALFANDHHDDIRAMPRVEVEILSVQVDCVRPAMDSRQPSTRAVTGGRGPVPGSRSGFAQVFGASFGPPAALPAPAAT